MFAILIGAIHAIDKNDCDDMQNHKLGDAMFNEYDMFEDLFAGNNVFPNEYDPLIPSNFDKKIYYDDSMPPIYDDYIDKSGFGRVSTLGSSDPTILEGVESYYNEVAIYDDYYDDIYAIKSDKSSMLVQHEKSDVCDSYIVESIHDVSENYYEEGTFALTYINNIKFLLYVLIVLKLHLFCLPMLVHSCSHKLFAHKILMHRKWVRPKGASHMLHDALFHVSILIFYASIIEIIMPS